MDTAHTDALRAWLCLSRVAAFRRTHRSQLLASLLAAAGSDAALGRLLQTQARRLCPRRSPCGELAARDLAWLDDPLNALIPIVDSRYPPLLREIPDAPVALYTRGRPSLLQAAQIAVVGSRNPTPSGREQARTLTADLVCRGLVVTSGLATGIDGAAHLAALEAGGATVAVAATGLDVAYPRSNRRLAERIVDGHGLLVSEYPPGTPPRREHFPRRNRIISGLCLGTVVVEATVRSGSLITARLAAEQGRDVFAVPGPVLSPLSRGCHALLRQGAKLTETAEDVIEEFAGLVPRAQVSKPVDATREPAAADGFLLQFIDRSPTTVDELVVRSGLTAQAVSSILLGLELRGLVTIAPGGAFLRTR